MLFRLRAVLRTPLLAALLACSAAACGGGGDGPIGPSGATLTKFAGDEQDGSPGETLFMPLVVVATDSRGMPVAGQTVTFAVQSGGGSVATAQVTTNMAGMAQTDFTLGAAFGTQAVSASMRGATPVVFTASAGAAPATQLAGVSGNAQTGTVGAALAAPVVVRATDQYGNAVAGVFVELTPAAAGGTLTPSSGTTDAAGQLSATWVLGTVAGPKTLTAAAYGLTSAAFTATAVAGPAAQLTTISGTELWGTVGQALPNPLVVGVTDTYGNAVAAGTSVTFAVTAGGGSVSPATLATDAQGRVSTTWTMGPRVGANSLSATASGLTAAAPTVTASVPIRALDHRVVDAEVSLATGKIVTVSANPSRLNVIDPETGTVQSVALTYTPLNVSVSPDGSRAAVGHDAYLSNVNLTSLTVTGSYLTSVIAGDVVLAGNGYAYVFPATGAQWTNIRSVNMTTGAVTVQTGNSIYGGTVAKLHPSGSYIYGADNNISPSDFEKYDVRGGTAAYMYDSPYHGDYSFAGNVWAFEDGSRLIARSGNLFRASAVQAEDMTYAGSLSGGAGIVWAVHSTAAARVLVLADGAYAQTGPAEFRAYDPTALQYMGSVPLPKFNVTGASGTTQYAAEGRFVFFNAAGTRAYTLIRANPASGLAADWGMAAFDRADIP